MQITSNLRVGKKNGMASAVFSACCKFILQLNSADASLTKGVILKILVKANSTSTTQGLAAPCLSYVKRRLLKQQSIHRHD